MIAGIAWPDLIIVIVLGIATFKGYSRGFVSELGGAVAVTGALGHAVVLQRKLRRADPSR